MRKIKNYVFFFLFFLFSIFCQNIFAQYKVISWESFEKGVISDSLQMRDNATPKNTQIIELTSKNLPSNIIAGRAKNECGKYIIKMTIPKLQDGAVILGLMNKTQFNRKELGQKGRSLYQVDFYLHENKQNVPNSMAVLASAPLEPGSNLLQIYRMGITSSDQVFFSYTNEKIQKGGPLLYKSDPLSNFNLKPGWHRFQIVFEGQEKIYCAIDGKQTSYSPITEPTLTNLQAGLMATSSSKYSKSTGDVEICYVDNLSIQMSPDDVPLPDSPWSGEMADRPAPIQILHDQQLQTLANQNVPQQPTTQTTAVSNQVNWLISPDEAWTKCQATKRPILVLFYAPRVSAYKKLEQIMLTDKTAQALLSKFVLFSVEVNQLQSWALCEKYMVFKVPCFVVIGTDGNTLNKTIFSNNSAWNDIAQIIQGYVN